METKKFKNFIVLWITQGLSGIGSSLTYFSIVFWFTQEVFPSESDTSKLALSLTMLSLCATIPGIIASPLIGGWVDRANRRNLLLSMDFLQSGIGIILFISYVTNQMNITLIMCLVCVSSFLATIHSLSFYSSYILLVPENQLFRANSLMQTLWTVTPIIAPILAASILSLPSDYFETNFIQFKNGISLVFLFDSLTFLISGISMLFINFPNTLNDNSEINKLSLYRNLINDIKIGYNFIKNSILLKWLVFLSILVNLANSTDILLPILIKNELESDYWSFQFKFAFLETAGFIGSTMCGIALVWLGGYKKRINGVFLPLIFFSITLLVFGLSKLFIISSFLFLLKSFFLMVFNTHTSTFWQESVPIEIQGRVFGFRNFISRITIPIGISLMGFLGARIPILYIYTSISLLILGITIYVFIEYKYSDEPRKTIKNANL